MSPAWNAPVATPTTRPKRGRWTRALGALPPERLAALRLLLHPSARLVRSAHPVASIWLAHQREEVAPPPAWHGEDVLVVRPDAEVLVHRLPAGSGAFIDALLSGRTVMEAAASCRDAAGFDLAGTLVGLFALGAVVALVPPPPSD